MRFAVCGLGFGVRANLLRGGDMQGQQCAGVGLRGLGAVLKQDVQ